MSPAPVLTHPGAVLLVSTYEMGHAPFALATAQAFLKTAGYEPAVLDLAVEAFDEDRVSAAKVIAISTPMHTAMRLAMDNLGRIQQTAPDAVVGFFGHYAFLHRDYLLSRGAHFALGGELDGALVSAITSASAPTRPGPSSLVSLDKLSFPVPDRTGMPSPGSYASYIDQHEVSYQSGYTETTRGCLDHCRHCPLPAVYGGRFFVISADVVLADIEGQIAQGAKHITFGDPDFLNGPGHGFAILRELHRRHPHITFDITAQVSHLLRNREQLAELVSLGCTFVTTAIESLSDSVLAALNKRHRRAHVEQLLELARDAGLRLRPTFVPFTPWTEIADLVELIDFVYEQKLVGQVAPVQLSIRLLVPPGSLLLESHPEAFAAYDSDALAHPWKHRDPRVDVLAHELATQTADDARAERSVVATMAGVRATIYRIAGLAMPDLQPANPSLVNLGPRLSEPWFC